MSKKPDKQDPLQTAAWRITANDTPEENNRFFTTLAQIIPVGIYRTDAQGNCIYVNECWSKITGMTPVNALGGGWAQAIHPDDRKRVAQAWYISAQARQNFIMEYRFQRPNGATRWVLGEAAAELDAAGEMVGHIGTVTDITQSKQMEEAKQEALGRLQKIASQVPGAIYQFRLRPDGSACVPYASDAMREIYRLNPEEIRENASKVFTPVHPDDLENLMASIHASARGLIPWQHEYRLKFDDGTVRWLLGNSMPQREADGSTLWHGFLTDITERKKGEERLLQSEARLRAYLDNISDTIWLIDANLNMAYVSPSVTRLLGVLPEDLLGRPSALVIHPDDMGIITNAMHYVMEHPGEPHTIQYRVSHKDGRWIHVESTGVNMLGNPAINGVLVTMRDITGRKQAEEQIRYLAFYDSLTQLPNRRLLGDRLEQTMAASKRSGRYGALMFLDMDNFKPLNDTYGHTVGDLLLVEVAHRISSCVRDMDTVARFGGDEFMVMLGELDADKAASATQTGIIAEKIRAILSKPYVLKFRHEGEAETTVEHHCTSSIGMVLFLGHQGSAEDIIKWADVAMYQAKNAGRNLIHFYE